MDLEQKINNIIRVIVASLSFSLLESLKDKTSLKLTGVAFVVYAIFAALMLVIVASLLAPLETISASANPQLIINMIIGLYATLAIFIIPLAIILTVINYWMIGRALKVSKRKYAPLTVIKFIKFILLSLAIGIIAFFSLYNIKWLWMLVIGAALSIGGAIMIAIGNLTGIGLMVLGVFVIILYGIVILYNTLRLLIAEAIFVEGEGIINSLKKSWVITKGNGWELFFSRGVFIFVILIITGICLAPSFIYSFMYMASTMLGGNPSAMAGMNYLTDPGYLIAILPSYLASAYAILAGSWFTVGLYNVLTKKK